MSISTFVATVVLVVGPWFYFFRSSFRPQSTKLRPAISTILLLHTLFILYYIIVLPPPNLFKQLQLPIAVPTDTIRNIVKAHANGRPLSATMEQMLTRMGSFETRTLYIRLVASAMVYAPHSHYLAIDLATTQSQLVNTVMTFGISRCTLSPPFLEHMLERPC